MVLLLFMSMLLLVWCSNTQVDWIDNENTVVQQQKETWWDGGKALKIVTTFLPLYAHTANLIDANDTLINLVPPGTSVHFWQPKPSDVLAMGEADLIITNGLWLEEFLVDYLDDLEKKWVKIVDSSVWVELIEIEEDDDDHDDHEDEEHSDHEGNHDHEWLDPHIWLDPSNAIIQVENITQALVWLDPSQEERYTEVSSQYSLSINELNLRLQDGFAQKEVRPFIVFHDAYQYFLRAYGLLENQVGLVQEFHGDTPSQRQIADLIQVIEKESVSTLYAEPQFDSSIIRSLEQETWVNTKQVDPIGNALNKNGYVRMLEALADAFLDV